MRKITFMKKLGTLIILGLFFAIGYGQQLNLRVGGNATIGRTLTQSYVGGTFVDEDTSAVLSTMIPITLDFKPLKFLALSVGYKTGSWLNEDPNDDNVDIVSKKIKAFTIGAKLFPISKKNYQMYFGFDMGFGGFRTEKRIHGFVTYIEEQKWAGNNMNLNFGMNWFYGKRFGSYFQMGYSVYNFSIKEYNLNGENQLDLFDITADMNVKGAQFELGLCYKLGKLEF